MNVREQESMELIHKGISEMQSGNIRSAIDSLNKAIECDRNNAGAWGLLGALLSKNNDERAVACFKEFIRIKPESPDGYQQLIFIYSRIKHTELALETAHNFTQLFPKNANAWATLAALCVETAEHENNNGGIDKGIEYYEKALELDPNNELAKEVLPSLYSRK